MVKISVESISLAEGKSQWLFAAIGDEPRETQHQNQILNKKENKRGSRLRAFTFMIFMKKNYFRSQAPCSLVSVSLLSLFVHFLP